MKVKGQEKEKHENARDDLHKDAKSKEE